MNILILQNSEEKLSIALLEQILNASPKNGIRAHLGCKPYYVVNLDMEGVDISGVTPAEVNQFNEIFQSAIQRGFNSLLIILPCQEEQQEEQQQQPKINP